MPPIPNNDIIAQPIIDWKKFGTIFSLIMIIYVSAYLAFLSLFGLRKDSFNWASLVSKSLLCYISRSSLPFSLIDWEFLVLVEFHKALANCTLEHDSFVESTFSFSRDTRRVVLSARNSVSRARYRVSFSLAVSP